MILLYITFDFHVILNYETFEFYAILIFLRLTFAQLQNGRKIKLIRVPWYRGRGDGTILHPVNTDPVRPWLYNDRCGCPHRPEAEVDLPKLLLGHQSPLVQKDQGPYPLVGAMLDHPNRGISQLFGESTIHDEHGTQEDVVVHAGEILDLVDRAGELAEEEFPANLVLLNLYLKLADEVCNQCLDLMCCCRQILAQKVSSVGL